MKRIGKPNLVRHMFDQGARLQEHLRRRAHF